jgi:hypothetical protein
MMMVGVSIVGIGSPVAMIMRVPRHVLVIRMTTGLVCVGRRFALGCRHPMFVEVKGTDQKKHPQQPADNPEQCRVQRTQFRGTVRQQVKQPNTQHQPADETQDQLHPKVRQRDQTR